MDEKSPCCGANVTFSGDGELYCKKCYRAVDPSVLQGPPVEVKLSTWPEGLTPDEERELAGLEAAFELAGGRGVELAERIDELRAKRDGEEGHGG